MFLMYQAKLTEKSLSVRIANLVEKLKEIPKECEAVFVSANFLQSVKCVNSISYFFKEEEKESAIDSLLQVMPPNLKLVLFENNRIFLLENKNITSYDSDKLLEIAGKRISFSLLCSEKTEKKSDINIIYNTHAFTLSLQEENEKHLSLLAKNSKTPTICLNAVYAADGDIFHGQSFEVDENGLIINRLKAFEEDCSEVQILNKDKTELPLTSNNDKYKIIFEALVFAIREHVLETGLTKAVLGLSGGIDSALVAPLAVEALGSENVYGLLMPSPHSSAHSVEDAKQLAENLNIKSYIFPIGESMEAFHKALNPVAKELNASEINHSLMLQNLQSRLRAVHVMGVANALPAFVLGTGNKSEEAMGYCTLYGDTCAALFPIGDLYKEDVYGLAKWYNNYKGKNIIPLSSIEKAPSAELAPGQKDVDSLPPYPKLDSFLYEIFELRKNPFEVEHEFSPQERREVLYKIKGAEFKRQQSAPIVKVTSFTLGKNLL